MVQRPYQGNLYAESQEYVQGLEVNHGTYLKTLLPILYFFFCIWISITRITLVFLNTILIYSGSKSVRFLYIHSIESYKMN